MCGIVGFTIPSGMNDAESVLNAMKDRIRHRGPDAEGSYLNGEIALGHRRLSIIDVTDQWCSSSTEKSTTTAKSVMLS